MSSPFDQAWARLQDLDEGTFSDPDVEVSYKPAVGSETVVTAIVGNETITDEQTPEGTRRVAYRDVTIWANQPDEAGDAIVPAKTASLVIGDDTYYIVETQAFSNQFDLKVMRIVVATVSRPGLTRPSKRGSYR